MHDLDAIRTKIAVDFAAIRANLCRITPPAGHRWEACPSTLTWFAGDVLSSTRHGASIFLRRFPRDDNDARQLHVEVRLFWSENSDSTPMPGAMRATLWALRGERIWLRSQSLLERSADFVHAEHREALLAELRTRIIAALRQYRAATMLGDMP